MLADMSVRSASAVREELGSAFANGQVHGSYLFHGPAGTGKRATAYHWARLLLGRDPDASDPEFWHPDLHVVEPEKSTLRIDQIRALQSSLALVPNEGGWRVGLLFETERITPQAANALLKTLEELPAQSSVVLTCTSPQALPPTVLSRTIGFRFAPEPESELRELLTADGLDADQAWLAAALGGASRDAVRSWAGEHLEAASEMRRALEALPSG